ncbi:nucleotidyltransferase family protein [bacterium]|nr:nucleotidyltransferase family protein [bacterium]
MGIDEILGDKREEILKIAEKHGALNVRVFGSVARGEATEDSDVDFLVEMGPNRSPFFPGGLWADLEDLLGRKVEILTPGGIKEDYKYEIMNEAVPL